MSKANDKQEAQTVEAKHIFIDIVSYTHNRSVEAQSDLISALNTIVKEAIDEQELYQDDVLYIPTGDGMCISLLDVSKPYDIHIKIGLAILEKLDAYNSQQNDTMRKFKLRIGVNENVDNLVTDINDKDNISGTGINLASRIEGICDENQIIVSDTVHSKLSNRETYMKSFRKYQTTVKHGVALNVYQYVDENLTFLNNKVPMMFKAKQVEKVRLTGFQAHFILTCLNKEKFIVDRNKMGQGPYSLIVLLHFLAEDSFAKAAKTKINPDYRIKVEGSLEDYYKILQETDFWIVYDLASFLGESLSSISDCFEGGGCLFVSEEGKRRLAEEYPKLNLEA